jgi:hypothetical protein
MRIDNDNGSCFYNIHDNVCAYGGLKSDFDGHHKYTFNSLDIFSKKGACFRAMEMHAEDRADGYTNNTCMMLGEGSLSRKSGQAGAYATFSACKNGTITEPGQVPRMAWCSVFDWDFCTC